MNQLCQRAAALLVLAGAVASCGGSAMPGPRVADEVPVPTSPEAALAQLDAAEAQLAGVLGPAAPVPAPAASAAPAAPPPPPPPPAPVTVSSRPEAHTYAEPPQATAAPQADREAPKAAEPCTTACSALASMERAADHLCTLAGAADGRCHAARERVKNASARVQASCPACAR